MAGQTAKQIRIDDLYYYFDAKERDRLDAGGLGRRQNSYLAMREKLLRLPDAQFDAAMRALDSLVGGVDDLPKPGEDKNRRKAALELFEAASAGMKAKAAERVSRV